MILLFCNFFNIFFLPFHTEKRIFIFIKNSDDLLLYALLTVLVNIVSILLMWVYVPRYIGKVVIDKKIIRRTIRPLLKLFLPQIATQVYTLLARTLVGFLSTKDQVIFYDYSQKIVNMVLAMITSIGVVLLPRVSNIIGNGKREEVPKIIEKTFKIVSYLSIPMAIGLMCVSKILVSWFLAPEYLIVGKLTAWTSLIIIAVSWANIIGVQYLIATKQENKYTLSIMIEKHLKYPDPNGWTEKINNTKIFQRCHAIAYRLSAKILRSLFRIRQHCNFFPA